MLRDIPTIVSVFNKCGAKYPLEDTMRLLDILSADKSGNAHPAGSGNDIDLEDIAAKRQQGIPLEYILGMARFMGRTFYCSYGTLIPTEETSLLVTTASDLVNARMRAGYGMQTVIEIGTGCGNIAVSLAKICDGSINILASDISADAIGIARSNVDHFNVQDKVALFCGDLFEPFSSYCGKTDVVISNPPYIPTTSLGRMAPAIIDHEPIIALDGGPYGLDFFRKLIKGASNVLKKDGLLVFEIGEGQEKLVDRLFERNPFFGEIDHIKHDDKVRVMSARLK